MPGTELEALAVGVGVMDAPLPNLAAAPHIRLYDETPDCYEQSGVPISI